MLRTLLTLTLLLPIVVVRADEAAPAKAVELTDKWTTLVLIKRSVPAAQEIPKEILVDSPQEFAFEGPHPDHPHLLGHFRTDGRYMLKAGALQREFGNSALLRLPHADQFDLEGIVQLGKEGGCLFLFGWDEESRSGYCVYHTHLRVSGHHWHLCEIKDGKAVPDSDQFLLQRQVEGQGALRIRIAENKLTLQVANAYILKEHELPNYRAGRVLLGTYSPRYGAKDIGVKSLRMKAN